MIYYELKNNIPKIEWKPDVLLYDDVSTITFKARKDRDTAIDLLCDYFPGIPVDMEGMIFVVPGKLIPFFKERRLRFSTGKVKPKSDLTIEEYTTLQRDRRM